MKRTILLSLCVLALLSSSAFGNEFLSNLPNSPKRKAQEKKKREMRKQNALFANLCKSPSNNRTSGSAAEQKARDYEEARDFSVADRPDNS